MKAYLVNPFEQTITEVRYSGNYQQIYSHLDCDCFTVADFNEQGDCVFVDDEGLISGKHQEFFMIDGYPTPLAGMGLILGTNQEGESTAPSITIDQARAMVQWVPAFMLRAMYA
jgi:hypothetical protein